MGIEMTNEQLDALADRLCDAWSKDDGMAFRQVAREAARWAQERERERLEPLRVAVEALKAARQAAYAQTDEDKVRLANITYRSAQGILEGAARTLLEQTE